MLLLLLLCIIVLTVPYLVIVIAVLPIRLIRKNNIHWKVDLRHTLPPITKQAADSCVVHAAAALLTRRGIYIDDPDATFTSFMNGAGGGMTEVETYRFLRRYVGYDYTVLSAVQILPTVLAGVPVMVGMLSTLHITGSIPTSIPFARQNLAKGHNFLEYLRKYSNKNYVSGHAVIICGVTTDHKHFMVRDSNGVECGEGGYWCMPVKMVTDNYLMAVTIDD